MTDTTDHNWHMTKVFSDRGFARLPKIPSEYGGDVSVYESSAAMGPHVWLTATAPADLNEPDGATVEAPLHLTADNARRLGEQLILTATDHYQGNPMRFALELIGTDCRNYTGATRCTDDNAIVQTGDVYAVERTYGRRSPYAKYGAERWCDGCIARTALEGGEFPERGADPNIEELSA